MPKAKFKVGQVVRVNTEWYRDVYKRQGKGQHSCGESIRISPSLAR